jgi:hypothetical protein
MTDFKSLNATILDSEVREYLERYVDYCNKLQEQNEQLQVQLAGCGVAALGGLNNPAKPGDYGYSQSYQDVLSLRQKYEELLNRNNLLK